jgi:hypothetical protein
MALMARRVQGGAPEQLRHFVAENLEALEPGLRVLETSLRLGRSTVDVVAVDGKQTLVLVSVAEVAAVTTMISALDAYIWCLAFPDNVRRLYPDAAIATARPPRLVFVAAKVPPAFLELLDRVSVIDPECHELAPSNEREDAEAAATDVRAALAASAWPSVDDRLIAVSEVEDAQEPVAVAMPAAARLSAGFDAAVARQWENFHTDETIAVAAAPTEPLAAVPASTPTWPARVQQVRAESAATLNGEPSNGHIQRTAAPSAPAAKAHAVKGHATKGHATKENAVNGHTNGHAANGHAAKAPVSVEIEAPVSRSTLAIGHAGNGKVANVQSPLAQAAEALLAQAIHAAEPNDVEHAAVNLGVRPRAEASAAPVAPATPAAPAPAAPAPRPGAESTPAAQRAGNEEPRTVNHPALQALRFPKGGVSRQWQEFLDQLAANQ